MNQMSNDKEETLSEIFYAQRCFILAMTLGCHCSWNRLNLCAKLTLW